MKRNFLAVVCLCLFSVCVCLFVCILGVCLLYWEVVELRAGEEAFAGTRTGVTWSTGLQAERKTGCFFFLSAITNTCTGTQEDNQREVS